jgi:hypothetical protein
LSPRNSVRIRALAFGALVFAAFVSVGCNKATPTTQNETPTGGNAGKAGNASNSEPRTFTRDDLTKIKEGMTLAEVESVLGKGTKATVAPTAEVDAVYDWVDAKQQKVRVGLKNGKAVFVEKTSK